jgi:hypothetical protein
MRRNWLQTESEKHSAHSLQQKLGGIVCSNSFLFRLFDAKDLFSQIFPEWSLTLFTVAESISDEGRGTELVRSKTHE